MAQDRIFDATLVIEPHEVLLQQGFLWTISKLIRIPKNSTTNLTWEVTSAEAHLHFSFTCDKDIEAELFLVNSFSGGEVLQPFNRNSRFAKTATPPSTVFRLGIVEEDVSSPVGSGLFPERQRLSFPPLIVTSLHQGVRLIHKGKGEARVWPIVLIHEQPIEKIPDGDKGPT